MRVDEVATLVGEVVRPGAFFAVAGCTVRVSRSQSDGCMSEVVDGRLLARWHRRRQKTFESWDVFLDDAAAAASTPLLSIKLDAAAGQLHVVRNIQIRGRENDTSWTTELTGTVELESVADAAALRLLLEHCVGLAVAGASRLPSTSMESPLPDFSLGRFAYLEGAGVPMADAATDPRQMIGRMVAGEQSAERKARPLEVALRAASPEDVPPLAERFVQRGRELSSSDAQMSRVLRALFNGLALSPYTSLVESLVAFLTALGKPGGSGLRGRSTSSGT